MSELDLRALLELLHERDVRFVVIGGVAVAAHGYVRGTEDLDLVPDPDPQNLERLTAALDDLEWLADWARRTSEDYNQNLICLGDFNVDRVGDPNFEALTSTGLQPPPELLGLPRTVSDRPGKSDTNHHYDQIAWFVEGKRERLTLTYEGEGHAGNFDWRPHLLTKMKAQEMSWPISDHFPLWVEFGR